MCDSLALIEQSQRLLARPTLREWAWTWWISRFVVDAAFGVAVLLLAQGAEIEAADTLPGAVAMGALGSGAARMKFLDWGPADDSIPVGIVSGFDRVRGFIEAKLDDSSATAQAGWIRHDVLPALEAADTDPNEMVAHLTDYVSGLKRLSPTETEQEIVYLRSVPQGDQSNKVKRELLIRHAAHELRAYKVIETFVARADGGSATSDLHG